MHVRWELYPVAHEGKKASYGGSYMEEFEWWEKPRTNSTIGELKVMVPEILFLKALWEHNRTMWLRSFPFHFGLYLLIACTALMVLTAAISAIWPTFASAGSATVLRNAVTVCGGLGMVLGLVGLPPRSTSSIWCFSLCPSGRRFCTSWLSIGNSCASDPLSPTW